MSKSGSTRRRGHAKNRNRGPEREAPPVSEEDRQKKEKAELELTSGEHRDFQTFANKYLWIQTKKGSFERLHLNKSQLFRESMLQQMEDAGVPLLVWEAKARQLGCSTHIQARMAHTVFTNRDESAMVAAHDRRPADEIFKKVKLFYDNLPANLKPLQKYNNRDELDLRAPSGPLGLRSYISVTTANNAEGSRGFTARQIHLSELAFYPNPEDFLLALLQSAPLVAGTMIYVESTCRGAGDYHHEQYLNAQVWWRTEDGEPDPPPWMKLKRHNPGDPNNRFYALFTPWFLMDEYTSPLPCSEEDFRASLDVIEQKLLEDFGEYLTLQHLQWRREAIQTKCGGHVSRFMQEYPSTDEEAFANTGTPAFDKDGVARQLIQNVCHCDVCRDHRRPVPANNNCPTHHWYDLVDGSVNTGLHRRIWREYTPTLIQASPGLGGLSVWSSPERGRRYVVFADVSAGMVGSDFDHAVVVDVGSLAQVAEWRGKIRQDEYASILLMLAIHYNRALLAPEATGIGAGLVMMLEQTRYPNLFRRSRYGMGNDPSSLASGWSTDRSTKPAMVASFDAALKHDRVVVRSAVVLAEVESYRVKLTRSQDGQSINHAQWAAPRGKHDDACIAMMGAYYLAESQPGAGRSTGLQERQFALTPSKQWGDREWSKYQQTSRTRAAGAAGLKKQ